MIGVLMTGRLLGFLTLEGERKTSGEEKNGRYTHG